MPSKLGLHYLNYKPTVYLSLLLVTALDGACGVGGAHLNIFTFALCRVTSVSSGGVYSDLLCDDGIQVPASLQ